MGRIAAPGLLRDKPATPSYKGRDLYEGRERNMTIKVFGHKSPDTDSTGSPMIWAWYLSEVKGTPAEAVLLGEPNTEAAFVMERWGLPKPQIIEDVAEGERCVVVDTNNPAELPDVIGEAEVLEIIDHHKLLAGNLKTQGADRHHRPAARLHRHDHARPDGRGCRADARGDQGRDALLHPQRHAGVPLAHDHRCRPKRWPRSWPPIWASRSPTMPAEMFAAKSDVSAFSDAELLRMDSKKYEVGGKSFRISVLETTSPATVLERKQRLHGGDDAGRQEDGVDHVLFFVVDILKEEATLLVASILRARWPRRASGDGRGRQVVLPGIVSRKKQIIPALKV